MQKNWTQEEIKLEKRGAQFGRKFYHEWIKQQSCCGIFGSQKTKVLQTTQ